jgi:hypothetical protein
MLMKQRKQMTTNVDLARRDGNATHALAKSIYVKSVLRFVECS